MRSGLRKPPTVRQLSALRSLDIKQTLAITIALVVLVMFLFLRKFWATVIPSVALPLSLIGTFGIMYLAGFSLDNLSLMALTISTGFVVDDAIVMIENIVRFIEAGDPPFEAALKGARQIGFTVVSLSISLIAVFIPLLFMTGIVGRLFREFAITMSVAVAVSAVISLTLTPMMCAKLLRSEKGRRKGAWGRQLLSAERRITSTRFRDLYEHGLRWVCAHQKFTLNVGDHHADCDHLSLHHNSERPPAAAGYRRHCRAWSMRLRTSRSTR